MARLIWLGGGVLVGFVMCILSPLVFAQGPPAKCEDTLAVYQELLATSRNARDVYEAQLAQTTAELKKARIDLEAARAAGATKEKK